MLVSRPTAIYYDPYGYSRYIITKRLYEGNLDNLSYVQYPQFYGKVRGVSWQLIPKIMTVALAKLTGLPLNTFFIYGFWSTISLPLVTYLFMNLYCKDKKLVTIGAISITFLVMGNPFLLISPQGIRRTFHISFLYGFLLFFNRKSVKYIFLILISIYFMLFSKSLDALFYIILLCLTLSTQIREIPLKFSLPVFITLIIVTFVSYFYQFKFMRLSNIILDWMAGPFAYSVVGGSIPYLYSPKTVSIQFVIALVVAVIGFAYILAFRRRNVEAKLFMDMCIVGVLFSFLKPRLVTKFIFFLQPIFCGSIIQLVERSKRRLGIIFIVFFMVLVLLTPILTFKSIYSKYGTFDSNYVEGIHWVEENISESFISDLKFSTAFYALTGSEQGRHILDNFDEQGYLTMLWYSSSIRDTIKYLELKKIRYIIITSDMSVTFIVCDYLRQPIPEKIMQIRSSEDFILLYGNSAIEIYELTK